MLTPTTTPAQHVTAQWRVTITSTTAAQTSSNFDSIFEPSNHSSVSVTTLGGGLQGELQTELDEDRDSLLGIHKSLHLPQLGEMHRVVPPQQ
jgi:hypothetical protein